MNDPAFFGFGSLVNLATHDYPAPRPARLQGWRRVWRHSQGPGPAFLSVEPADDAQIDGIVAHVPNGDWDRLDQREAGYDRVDITGALDHAGPVAVYQVKAHHYAPPVAPSPILLSYLDVVVQGYWQMFGVDGVADFFASTKGWDVGVQDDRASPRYPRAQVLLPAQTALVDQYLATVMEQAK